MFTLDLTTASLEVVLAGAVTTNQLPIVSNFADKTASAFTPNKTTTQTNNTSTVTIVAAPAASTSREVHTINIYNADTVVATITVRENDNGTLRTLVKTTLSVGDTLIYCHASGWRVMDSMGAEKTSSGITLTGDVTGSGSSSITTTIANDVVTNAKLANMANATIKGRSTAGTGDPEDLTTTQLAAFIPNLTIQTFTTGSGTYTTPANCKRIRIRAVGAGGGGGGGGTGSPGNGSAGGNTTFSTLTAGGGAGGPNTVTGGFAGGSGGTSSGGDINGSGGTAASTIGNSTPTVFNAYGGTGGNSFLGAGGAGGVNGGGSGNNGTGFGAGGGGAGGTATALSSAPGGGGGGYCEKNINSPASTYSYAVGAGGTGGTAGTGGGSGGNGTNGFIIVEEYYI